MISIGEFARLANVSPRTIRYYESIGLIKSQGRGENNYRYYDKVELAQVSRIKNLQDLGFSLEEVKEILKIDADQYSDSLRRKLSEVDVDLKALQTRKSKILSLLSVSHKIDSNESINDTERKVYMDAIKEEIVANLQNRIGALTSRHLDYLQRDSLFDSTKAEFIRAVQKCVEFAKTHHIKLGPGRGSSPASPVLFALGFTDFDPLKNGLLPERLPTENLDLWIDVEYERGQPFVDFCKEISKNLGFGQINAFKMPLMDIVQNVHQRIGKEIEYEKIDDNSDTVLEPFRKGDVSKIFQIDMSENALIMKYENQMPGYAGLDKITEYFKTQKIHNARDVINITAVWRPYSQDMLHRIALYKMAKDMGFRYSFLPDHLQKLLEPNFGVILYQEEIMQIIQHYTGWSLDRCRILRRDLMRNQKNPESVRDFVEFQALAPTQVATLVKEESPYSFCQPHAFVSWNFTKQTAVLKSLHQNIYYEEIEKWEQKHQLCWDELGIRQKGVSLLQS